MRYFTHLITVLFAAITRRGFIFNWIELVLFLFLILWGWLLMLPASPDISIKHAFMLDVHGDDEAIEKVEFFYQYEKKEISIRIKLSSSVKEETELRFSFPYHVKKQKKDTYDDYKVENNLNESTVFVKISPDNKSDNIIIPLYGNSMKKFSDSEEYTFINVRTRTPSTISFPIEYNFERSPFSKIDIDGKAGEYYFDYTYHNWKDVFNGDRAMLKIETSELKKKGQNKVIFGTILLTIGLSHITNLIYTFLEAKKRRRKTN